MNIRKIATFSIATILSASALGAQEHTNHHEKPHATHKPVTVYGQMGPVVGNKAHYASMVEAGIELEKGNKIQGVFEANGRAYNFIAASEDQFKGGELITGAGVRVMLPQGFFAQSTLESHAEGFELPSHEEGVTSRGVRENALHALWGIGYKTNTVQAQVQGIFADFSPKYDALSQQVKLDAQHPKVPVGVHIVTERTVPGKEHHFKPFTTTYAELRGNKGLLNHIYLGVGTMSLVDVRTAAEEHGHFESPRRTAQRVIKGGVYARF